MAFEETVTLVNRTNRILKVQFDGQTLDLPPGPITGFPKVAVDFAKAQNPVMGTGDPYDPTNFQSLVGVKGVDNCTPLENNPNEVERIDRGKVFGRYSKENTRRVKAGGISNFEAHQGMGGGSVAAEFGRE